MIRKLSSVKFAFYNLVFMICLMGTGVFLSRTHRPGFNIMNNAHVFDWYNTAWSESYIPMVWFCLLCLGAFLLFINAFFCTMAKQLQMALKSKTLKKWLFFILHILFIIVLLCHGLTLITGSKKSNITLLPGQSTWFEGQYMINVSKIVFNDDLSILNIDKDKQRKFMTRKNFNRKHNYAVISLFKDLQKQGVLKLLKTNKVIMLSPLKYKTIQITLQEFIIKKNKPAVKITVTENFLTTFFFVIYAMMIVTLGLYILMTIKHHQPLLLHDKTPGIFHADKAGG